MSNRPRPQLNPADAIEAAKRRTGPLDHRHQTPFGELPETAEQRILPQRHRHHHHPPHGTLPRPPHTPPPRLPTLRLEHRVVARQPHRTRPRRTPRQQHPPAAPNPHPDHRGPPMTRIRISHGERSLDLAADRTPINDLVDAALTAWHRLDHHPTADAAADDFQLGFVSTAHLPASELAEAR